MREFEIKYSTELGGPIIHEIVRAETFGTLTPNRDGSGQAFFFGPGSKETRQTLRVIDFAVEFSCGARWTPTPSKAPRWWNRRCSFRFADGERCLGRRLHYGHHEIPTTAHLNERPSGTKSSADPRTFAGADALAKEALRARYPVNENFCYPIAQDGQEYLGRGR